MAKSKVTSATTTATAPEGALPKKRSARTVVDIIAKTARRQIATPQPHVLPTARLSRKATLMALLSRPEGAALSELVAATAWQAHSVRAALTHFRQAGHVIGRVCDDSGASRYHMTTA